jgi:hypothetical protein
VVSGLKTDLQTRWRQICFPLCEVGFPRFIYRLSKQARFLSPAHGLSCDLHVDQLAVGLLSLVDADVEVSDSLAPFEVVRDKAGQMLEEKIRILNRQVLGALSHSLDVSVKFFDPAVYTAELDKVFVDP